ncbi:MAG: transposase, partial [Myxococcota bacterium]
MHGRFLLKPSPELNQLILGIIGRALSLYKINIYLFVALSNHMHWLLSAPDTSELARFMNHVNGNIAREVAKLYLWHDHVWGRRYTAIPILDDESIIGRARYILSNGCKEGLVVSPYDWPGVNCIEALITGNPISCVWVSRTKESARLSRMNLSNNGKTVSDEADSALKYEIRLSPLPPWADLPQQTQQNLWIQMIAEIEEAT